MSFEIKGYLAQLVLIYNIFITNLSRRRNTDRAKNMPKVLLIKVRVTLLKKEGLCLTEPHIHTTTTNMILSH